MIAVIIRTKNEERWIAHCLKRVLDQTLGDLDIILIDNNSTDKTVEYARQVYPDIKVVSIDRYYPGEAINRGIRTSRAEYLAILSAHCLPVDKYWLENLYMNFDNPQIAGVYGRQIPLSHTGEGDKRDLINTFGLDKRIQVKDSFFHNANSMILRKVWAQYPFDSHVANIEDRIWGKQVIDAGFSLVYEPAAPVYHYHGIHQNNDRERMRNVSRILESLDLYPEKSMPHPLQASQIEVIGIIPLINITDGGFDPARVMDAIKALQTCCYIKHFLVATNHSKTIDVATKLGIPICYLNDRQTSAFDSLKDAGWPNQGRSDNDSIFGDDYSNNLDAVLSDVLHHIEQRKIFDLVALLNPSAATKLQGYVDSMIETLLEDGLDSIITYDNSNIHDWLCVTYPDRVRNQSWRQPTDKTHFVGCSTCSNTLSMAT